MTGIALIGENPLRYANSKTGKKLEVRSLVDPENGKKVCIVFDGDAMQVVQAHGTSLKNKEWKRTLKLDENDDNMGQSKTCDAAEKTRIESVTNKVSSAEIV